MKSEEALRILRERMVAISRTASEGGCLNYGSLTVQPAEVQQAPERVLVTAR